MIFKSLGWEARETVNPLHPRDAGLAAMFGFGLQTASGVSVTPDKALRSVAVFSAVRVLSETMATLPAIVYRRLKGGGRERATDHRVYKLLHRRPNRFQTPAEFKEMLQGHICLRGNGYAEILATGGNPTAELMPLHPDRVEPFWAPDGTRAYAYTEREGGRRVILGSEMFHVMGFSQDGLKGSSPIELARNAIGLEIAQEELAGFQIQNGARPAGILKTATPLEEEGRKRLKEQWQAAQSGARNAGKVAVLEQGLEWQQIGMTAHDAQFLEQRKFSISQIARLFRVPPHMIGVLERATFTNIEHQSIEFVKFTMMPWLTKWEQALTRDVFLESEADTYFAEFLVDALLRGDQNARYTAYQRGILSGFLSVNDVRRMENFDEIDNGNVYLTPMNMAPTGGDDVDDVLAKIRELLNGAKQN